MIKIASAIQANSEVNNIEELHNSNQKTINDIYLKTFASNIDSFTTNQIEQLTEIAFQCPYIGGSSVYTARYLLSFIDHYSAFDDSILCSGYGRIGQDESIQPFCLVYPNPVDKTIFVSYMLAGNEGQFVIFDELGRQILATDLSVQNSTILIDISNLHHGIYLYQIKSSNLKVFQGKFLKAE